MKAHELLTLARKKIEKQENWTQHVSWRDSDGKETCCGERAKCFCLYGAIAHVRFEFNGMIDATDAFFAIECIEEAVKDRYAHNWNDDPNRTHQEVLNAFDRAIAIALL